MKNQTKKLPVVYLVLNLTGEIVATYSSGLRLAKAIGRKYQIEYSKVNTKTISGKKFRIVTREYYNTHLDIIKSWPKFSNKAVLRTSNFKAPKYRLTKGEEIHNINTKVKGGKLLNITREGFNYILTRMKEHEVTKRLHSKSGYMIEIL